MIYYNGAASTTIRLLLFSIDMFYCVMVLPHLGGWGGVEWEGGAFLDAALDPVVEAPAQEGVVVDGRFVLGHNLHRGM